MRVLVVGSGGREHAITWALSRSTHRPEIYIAPGNPGTAQLGRNVPIAADDLKGLTEFAVEQDVDLCVVGPEVPLVMGLADRLREVGVAVVGPSAAAAQLEGSKAFSKAFMGRHGIPTAAFRSFQREELDQAEAFVRQEGAPIVVKASGLAAGKGAVVCATVDEALDALRDMMRDGGFGEAASQVVVESFMTGEEVSLFALCDGRDFVLLSPAQDHKRIGEGDTGPNTGGMGAYCPAPVATAAFVERACREIIQPTLKGMAEEGHPYQGVLYVGLMATAEGPQVVEYNCRLGDPETQPVLMLLDSDAVDLFMATARGGLRDFNVRLKPGSAACVVLASAGYPGNYKKGYVIQGLTRATGTEGVQIFHAGTREASPPPPSPIPSATLGIPVAPVGVGSPGTRIETAGGRVLGVTAAGETLQEALDRAYEACGLIHFEGIQFRRDIGRRGLEREG